MRIRDENDLSGSQMGFALVQLIQTSIHYKPRIDKPVPDLTVASMTILVMTSICLGITSWSLLTPLAPWTFPIVKLSLNQVRNKIEGSCPVKGTFRLSPRHLGEQRADLSND